MDVVIDFVERFIDAEYRALIATHSELDDASFERARDAATAFLHTGPGSIVSLGFGRPSGVPVAELMSLEEAERQFHPRPFYGVAAFDVDGRDIYRAVLGSARDAEGYDYDTALNIANVDGDLRVIGKSATDPFGPADRVEWEPLGGVQVPDGLEPTGARVVRRPGNPVHAADIDRWPTRGSS